MSSPIFTENSPFAKGTQVNHEGGVMTFENTMQKSVGMFVLTLVGMVIGWFYIPIGMASLLSLVAFVLSLVAIFKKEPSPPLYIATTGVFGLAFGALSGFLESRYEGIVVQAVLATVVVISVVFALFKSGKFRSSPKMNKIFMVVGIAYGLFCLANFFLSMFGAVDGMFGLRSSVEIFGIPLGLILGPLAIILGAYSLVLDFEYIERGITLALPEKYGWTAAYGLVLTVIWLYLEILRFLAILRN